MVDRAQSQDFKINPHTGSARFPPAFKMGIAQSFSTAERENYEESQISPQDESHKRIKIVLHDREAASSQGQVVPAMSLDGDEVNKGSQEEKTFRPILSETHKEHIGSTAMVRGHSPYQWLVCSLPMISDYRSPSPMEGVQEARSVLPQVAWKPDFVAFGVCPMESCGLPLYCVKLPFMDCSLGDQYDKARCRTCRPKDVNLDTHWYICRSTSCGVYNFPKGTDSHRPSEDRCMQCDGRSVLVDAADVKVECRDCRTGRLANLPSMDQSTHTEYCPRLSRWRHKPD